MSDQITSEGQIDRRATLLRAPLFAGFADEVIARLAKMARIAAYPEGDEIIEQDAEFDEESDGLFFLIDGAVEVRRGSTDGTDGRLLARLGPGDFFGELSLLDGRPRSASVFAVEEAICLVLGRWDFLRELRKDPVIAEKMLVTVAGRLRDVYESEGRPE
ncbi:MAG: cyclic nucleotide-binding domain-containing protein [Gaiellaceae bacterium]